MAQCCSLHASAPSWKAETWRCLSATFSLKLWGRIIFLRGRNWLAGTWAYSNKAIPQVCNEMLRQMAHLQCGILLESWSVLIRSLVVGEEVSDWPCLESGSLCSGKEFSSYSSGMWMFKTSYFVYLSGCSVERKTHHPVQRNCCVGAAGPHLLLR